MANVQVIFIVTQGFIVGWDAAVIQGFAFAVFVLFCVVIRLVGRYLSLWQARPLRDSIDAICQRPFSIPTYATTARAIPPQPPEGDGDEWKSLRNWSKAAWYPIYVPLHRQSVANRTSLLLASASLPFGIVPSVKFAGSELVDGGVVDNCPIAPLIEQEHCDELIVVLLRPIEDEDLFERQLRCQYEKSREFRAGVRRCGR
jgi:hypothetical protein